MRRQLTRAEFDSLEVVGLVAIEHSVIKAHEEHQGRIDIGGASMLFRVTRTASLFVASAF